MPVSHDSHPDIEPWIVDAVRAWQQDPEHQRPRRQEPTMIDHPDAETLLAYQTGSLSGKADDALRQHLADCAECRSDLDALAAFDEPATADPDPDHRERLERSWQGFADARRATSPAPPPTPRWSWSSVLPLAASLVLAVLGVASFVMAPATTGNRALVIDLLPDGASVERASRGPEDVAIPDGVDLVVVARALLGDLTPHDRFELALDDAAGNAVARLPDAIRDPEGRFALTVPRSAVPDGDYRLTLFGVDTDRRTVLAVYSFRLSDAG